MDYTSLDIRCGEEFSEILIAELSDYPFETFTTDEGVLSAYIQTAKLDACREEVVDLLQRYKVEGAFREIPTENWNAKWEDESFSPVEVEGRLLIRAPYHEAAAEGVMDVVLTPQMSFGSGHHATTWMMSRAVLDLGVEGRRGLDIGSGTGVLAIVAAKCGAEHIDAVDIDDVCYRSCLDNVAQNHVEDRVESIEGDISVVEDRRYDFILANIHRNILIGQMAQSARMLTEGGDLLMSGFLEDDVRDIISSAESVGLKHVQTIERAGWQMVHVRK